MKANEFITDQLISKFADAIEKPEVLQRDDLLKSSGKDMSLSSMSWISILWYYDCGKNKNKSEAKLPEIPMEVDIGADNPQMSTRTFLIKNMQSNNNNNLLTGYVHHNSGFQNSPI